MEAEIQTIYHSPNLCSVHNFLCQCMECTISAKEYQDTFSIAFIRKGSFGFKIYREELDAYSGLFLICKAGYEHQVRHIHDIPDQCTIFSFSVDSAAELTAQSNTLSRFFKNPDMQSILIKATPEMEFLHQVIFQELSKPRRQQLWVEQLMVALFTQILSGNNEGLPTLSRKQQIHYLPMIETVKSFIYTHYTADIQLSELANIAHVSPFHFSRLFKKVTEVSPYEYLLRIRLKEAQLQLLHTRDSITSIAFSTGFNSLEHFSAAYKKQFGKSPAAMRS
ncbi:MAG: helix-turn-helix transcriptional regulator [Chitinophaga sp.]|uniref:helix-turn-helix domain-containing protein n=1 Tax=Chitinophaga sp. TaxID=1869181 RepID=UPI0025C3A9F0|nr:AraC family transcriptional regulator [Chitinophaga sp.]MBV8251532.1 helix-turn-helix transcriptional regulator [Chitinophaga sp.]